MFGADHRVEEIEASVALYPSLAGLAATYSSKPSDLVPLALGRLTAEFGMGSGLGSPLEPPGRRRTDLKQAFRKAKRVVPGLVPGTSRRKCRSFVHQFAPLALVLRDARLRTLLRTRMSSMGIGNESDQADRTISTGKLHALPHFHTRPINVMVYHGSV